MGLFDHWPYTNFHELNLTWLLRLMEELSNKVDNFVALNTIKYADPIQWNITTQYETNTVVVDPQTGTAYLSSQPVPSGVSLSNTDYWSVIFTLDMISANDNITFRDDGNNVLATFTSAVDDWLLWNGNLYKVTRPINVNEAYVAGYNLDRYSVELFIGDAVTTLMGEISDTYNTIIGIIGDLDNLSTTDKSSIVNAINEINSKKEAFINVLDYGFDNTGTDDNSSLVATLPADKVWVFPAGTYNFDSPITFNDFRIMAYGAIFKATDTMSDFITTSVTDMSVTSINNYFLKGAIIDGDYKCNTALKCTGGRSCKFTDITIKNVNTTGINITYGGQYFTNIDLNQEYSSPSDVPLNTVGIRDSNDSQIINASIVDFTTGIICGAGSSYKSVLVWLALTELYDNSIAYDIGDNIISNFVDCTVDTMQTGFYFRGSYNGIAAKGIIYMINSNVITDVYIQSLATESALFAKSNAASSNKIVASDNLAFLHDYHVKMFSDVFYNAINANVYNSPNYPRVTMFASYGISNLTNIVNANLHESLSSPALTSNYAISGSHLSYEHDSLDGTVIIDKGDTTTPWISGNLVHFATAPTSECWFPAYLSPDKYALGEATFAYVNSAGNMVINNINAAANTPYRYAIIPIHMVCTVATHL